MAEVSRSVSLTKKFSSVNDVSTRHMYDGVFASPPPPRNARLDGSAAFTSRVEDYGEIFASSPSQAVPSPIPILDLPAADRRIPGIDYTGVFGGNDRIGISFEELVASQSKKAVKEERQLPPLPRNPIQTTSLDTKSQEFPVTSGKYRTSNSSWTRPSKSQEFPINSVINQKPDSSGSFLTSKIPRKQPSRSQEFPLNTGINSVPTSLSNGQAATPCGRQPSISEEFPLNNGNDQTSTSESSGQSFDTAKHFNVSYNKINNLNADGTTHIAELNAVPGYTCLFNEVDLPKKKVLDNMRSDVSPRDANVNMDDEKKRSQGKMTRAVSNPGINKQACEQSTGFQRGFSGPLNSLDDRREVDCKPQHPSFSSSWGPHSFGNESFFKRSTSQMSKGFPNNQQEGPGIDSLLSLLEEELDANSEAAISAEAVRRAIEEAELQIRLAKQLLQGNDSNGSIKMSFKDTLKVRAPSGMESSNETNVLLEPKKVKIRSEKKHVDKVKGPKPRNLVQGNGTRETKLGDVADRTNEKPHEDSVRVDPACEMAVNSGSSCAYATAEEVSQYTEQREPLNQTKEVVDGSSIPVESQLAQKNHRQEVVGGEWEPAKQISQLFSGMKNRFVSFMSKQQEIVKKEPCMDVPNAGRLSGQSAENALNVTKNVDAHKKPETSREELSGMEAEVNMRAATVLVAGESEENLHKVGAQTEISEIDAREVKYGVTMEHEKDVEEVTLFPDSKNNNDESFDHLTPNIEVEKMETGVFGMDEQQENIVAMFPDGMKDHGVPSDHPEPEIEVGKRVQELKLNEPQENIVTMSPDDIKHNDEVGDHPEPEIEVGKQVQEFEVNEQLENVSEELTVSPDVEKRNVEPRCQPEPELSSVNEELSVSPDVEKRNVEPRCQPEPELSSEERKFEKENVASEVKDESSMGEAEEISQGRSGNSTRLGHENGQMNTVELKEDVERVEETCSSLAANDDDGEITSWESSDERADEIETELMFQAKADDSFHSANGSSRFEEIKIEEEDKEEHRGEEAENAWDMQQKPDNIEVLEAAAIEEPSNIEEDEETRGGEEIEDLKPGDVLDAKLSGHAEVIDDASEHKEHLAATDDACKLVEFSFLSRNEENSEEGDESCESPPDEQLSYVDMEAMTALKGSITKPAEEQKQIPSVEVADESTQEEVMKTSTVSGDTVDTDKIKEETKDGSGALRVNFCIWPCETKQNSEQELDDVEAKGFITSSNLDNQGDKVDGESEAATGLCGPNLDCHNDQSDESKGEEKHSTETSSHRRRRWFESREQVESHQQPSILVQDMPVEIIQEMQQHIKELKSDDCVEIHVDNIVEESKEDINGGLDEGVLDKDGGGHSNTETSHRRRRWFDNGQETGVPQKPTLFNGNGTCKDMNQLISDESKVNEPCQGGVEEAGSERRDATVWESQLGSDRGENRNNIEAAHRRKRWFENGEKLGPGQRVGILEGNGSTVEVKDETVTREKHDRRGETSTTERESSDSYGKADSESIRQQRDMAEENNRKKEREKERIAVERAIREARERAFVEARERAFVEARERAAAEKANIEARLKAAAQDRGAGRDANNKSASDKASVEAKLRAERAAVERATAEARERALQKAMSDKTANRVREKDNKTQTSSTSTSASGDKSSGVINESPQRRKARMERNQRTMERAAKALEEKNMRDALVQREQAERNKFADSLDLEVKRWSSGKEGNLRALLSTLQYVLGTESGWQPISLTDLINPTAVRKAYKRAALCVHPDKLQQRGATIQQKYICEKVFDLLKEAWYKFNPDDR